jgi:hypothetical protein
MIRFAARLLTLTIVGAAVLSGWLTPSEAAAGDAWTGDRG